MGEEQLSVTTLLLIDDDCQFLHMMAEGLRAAGFDVLEASSGDAALQLALEAEPDLAICDVRMPGMSGLELVPKLRDQAGVPFVFLSSYGDEELVKLASQYGALGYLVKPMDVSDMLPTIRTALVRAAEIRRLYHSEEQLNAALANSRETSMATGVLMERYHLNRSAAFQLLRSHARSNRKKLTDLAAEFLDAVEKTHEIQPTLGGKREL